MPYGLNRNRAAAVAGQLRWGPRALPVSARHGVIEHPFLVLTLYQQSARTHVRGGGPPARQPSGRGGIGRRSAHDRHVREFAGCVAFLEEKESFGF